MRIRGADLARMLLGLGGLSSTVAVTVACSCDFTEVRPIDAAAYDSLHEQYGSAVLGADTCASLCGTAPEPTDTGFSQSSIATQSCRLVRIDWDQTGVQCDQTETDCGIGRRPTGLQPLQSERFARMAQLEAASVVSFLRLADDLRRHHAPQGLIDAAHRAAEDEERHARLALALSRREGIEPEPAVIHPVEPRTLLNIAIENAVEGCVGETLGAVEAAREATQSPDPVIRRTMSAIARDEAVHAALSFAIHDWVSTRLSPSERTQVRTAQRRAIDDLVRRPSRRADLEALQPLWAA